MLFNSIGFIVFFPIVYLTYRLLPHRAQNAFLLLASYVFYGAWDWRFLGLIAFSTLVDYVCGRKMTEAEGPRRKTLLTISVATNLGLLGVFKYFDFFASGLQDVLGLAGLHVGAPVLDILLPVGISFYTFQTLSYTIDIYRGELEPEHDLITFALFVAFFPQLVAGPIERAQKLLPQLRTPRMITAGHLREGAWLILWGYFLKCVVADNLAPIASAAFDAAGPVESGTALLGVYAFAFQIFGDFAGYSAIAIGTALLMGVRLSTNFLFPYFVTNPRDFWHNWHISLSTWLRDYLYIPLGGSRGPRAFVYRNLLLTMLLGGLWHGAAWTFILWGGFHGVLLIVHRFWTERFPDPVLPRNTAAGDAWWLARVVIMFHITCLGWLIFRAPTVAHAGAMLSWIVSDLTYPATETVYAGLQFTALASIVLALQWLQRNAGLSPHLPHARPLLRASTALALVYALLIWGSYGGSAFIYFQF